MPNQAGDFVVKVLPATGKKNPYFGVRYVWVSLGEVDHAGAGEWVVDSEATYTSEGLRHLNCKYCGGACNYSSIPKLLGVAVGTTVKAGTGASCAQYKIGEGNTATYAKAAVSKSVTKATVPATITVNGETYAVTAIGSKAFAGYAKLKTLSIKASELGKIGASAFSGCKKLKSLTLKLPELTKKGVKNSLKGSSVKTVKTTGSLKADYKKYFTEKNCGAAVTVK